MTVEFSKRYNQLICSWDVPKPFVFKGKEIILNRRLTRRVGLDNNGNIIPTELAKLGSEQRESALLLELARLRRSGKICG